MTRTNDPDHDRGMRDHPETSRGAALEEAKANEAACRDNLAWMARVPETMEQACDRSRAIRVDRAAGV